MSMHIIGKRKIITSQTINQSLLKKIFSIQDTLNISDIANKSGIDAETISAILYSKTKNPGVYTVAKIADVFGCTIEELLSDSNPDKEVELKVKFARECINVVLDLLDRSEQKITFDNFLLMLKTIYLHAVHTKATAVDVEFAKKHVKEECSKIG